MCCTAIYITVDYLSSPKLHSLHFFSLVQYSCFSTSKLYKRCFCVSVLPVLHVIGLAYIIILEMVGRRALHAFGDGKSSGHSQKQINGSNPYKPKPAAFRFQDAANAAVEDERRNKIKNSLIDAVKGDELETFRKSDEEVRTSVFILLTVFA